MYSSLQGWRDGMSARPPRLRHNLLAFNADEWCPTRVRFYFRWHDAAPRTGMDALTQHVAGAASHVETAFDVTRVRAPRRRRASSSSSCSEEPPLAAGGSSSDTADGAELGYMTVPRWLGVGDAEQTEVTVTTLRETGVTLCRKMDYPTPLWTCVDPWQQDAEAVRAVYRAQMAAVGAPYNAHAEWNVKVGWLGCPWAARVADAPAYTCSELVVASLVGTCWDVSPWVDPATSTPEAVHAALQRLLRMQREVGPPTVPTPRR